MEQVVERSDTAGTTWPASDEASRCGTAICRTVSAAVHGLLQLAGRLSPQSMGSCKLQDGYSRSQWALASCRTVIPAVHGLLQVAGRLSSRFMGSCVLHCLFMGRFSLFARQQRCMRVNGIHATAVKCASFCPRMLERGLLARVPAGGLRYSLCHGHLPRREGIQLAQFPQNVL